MINIGNLIKNRRNELGLTVQELATRADTSVSTIYQIEAQRELPYDDTFERINEVLKIQPLFLDYCVIDKNRIARNLKYFRVLNGDTQGTFAEKADLSRATIHAYEHSKQEKNNLNVIKKISKALGMTLPEFSLIDADDIRLGESIKFYREEKHFTIEELSEKTGYEIKKIESAERGVFQPNFNQELKYFPFLKNISEILEHPVEDFFTKCDDKIEKSSDDLFYEFITDELAEGYPDGDAVSNEDYADHVYRTLERLAKFTNISLEYLEEMNRIGMTNIHNKFFNDVSNRYFHVRNCRNLDNPGISIEYAYEEYKIAVATIKNKLNERNEHLKRATIIDEEITEILNKLSK